MKILSELPIADIFVSAIIIAIYLTSGVWLVGNMWKDKSRWDSVKNTLGGFGFMVVALTIAILVYHWLK